MSAVLPGAQNESGATHSLIGWFAAAAAVKVAALALFSSEYQDRLFVPFVQHFLSRGGNPWQDLFGVQPDAFPYPPLMLYLLSFFLWPAALLGAGPLFQNILFKLPTLVADVSIGLLLLRMFPGRRREVLIYYWASAVVLYAAYMHGQLDLIPMAVLLLALYLLSRHRFLLAAVALGAALSIKFHIAAALPFIAIYVARNHGLRRAWLLFSLPFAIYLLLSLPYLFSDGYVAMVLKNPKQMTAVDVFYPIGDLKVILPVFAVLVLLLRFAAYAKINADLFYTFLGILFSVFVLLVFPSPAWYLWPIPFVCLFFIRNAADRPEILALHVALNATYVVYFVFFHRPDHGDLSWLGAPVAIKVADERLRNLVFTTLEVVLAGTIYLQYRFGVRSNAVYRPSRNLVVGVSGDSAAGKTTLVSDIKLLLCERVLELEGDADHKWARGDENWQTYTHLHPKANELHRQAQDLLALKSGRSVSRPDYDHDTGTFTTRRQIAPRDYIILSGLHPFYLPISRKVIDVKIYLDTEETLRRQWKRERDASERGYTPAQVEEQLERRAEDARKYILPQRDHADIIVAYFTDPGVAGTAALRLKVTLSSSLQIEPIVSGLEEQGLLLSWDYSDDLRNQFIVLGDAPGRGLIIALAQQAMPNFTELLGVDAQWLEGYRGFVQLIALLAISEKSREGSKEVD